MADVTMSERDVQDLGAFRYLGSTPGELAKKIKDFEDDNAKLREKVRGLEEKAKGLPPEGAVVLTAEEAKVHEAWKALDLKPEDVATLKAERDTLKDKDAQRTRQDAFSGAVKALGWPEDTVVTLLDMRSLDGATVELKPEKVRDPKTGKDVDVQVPYVTLAGDGQKPQKFAEFASTAPQLKGIRTDAGGNGNGTGGEGRFVAEQFGAGRAATGSTEGGIDAMIEANRKAAAAPNPLRPAKATT